MVIASVKLEVPIKEFDEDERPNNARYYLDVGGTRRLTAMTKDDLLKKLTIYIQNHLFW